MADVVFNGSRSRKPVSRASVELVFDNLDGRVGGRFAAYNEIAVRRQIVRDGQSSYWLNGTRCRRRDVMDVFHGTGLGPRSYAIIEQGMISRIIEAKPDDLRDFLEEAAGISKYKERRRETEHRMRHTLENLDRLNDLREELARRLAHLKRQATHGREVSRAQGGPARAGGRASRAPVACSRRAGERQRQAHRRPAEPAGRGAGRSASGRGAAREGAVRALRGGGYLQPPLPQCDRGGSGGRAHRGVHSVDPQAPGRDLRHFARGRRARGNGETPDRDRTQAARRARRAARARGAGAGRAPGEVVERTARAEPHRG